LSREEQRVKIQKKPLPDCWCAVQATTIGQGPIFYYEAWPFCGIMDETIILKVEWGGAYDAAGIHRACEEELSQSGNCLNGYFKERPRQERIRG